MRRQADIIIFQHLTEKHLSTLIDQISYLSSYNELVDYIYDPSSYQINGIVQGETVVVLLEKIYNSTLKQRYLDNDLVFCLSVTGTYIKPILTKPNYHIVEIYDGIESTQHELYYNYFQKIKLI